MFYQLLKAGAVIQAWRWLRPRLWGLVVLFVSIVAILIAHSEYLGYVERTGNTGNLLLSYLLKWGGLLILVLIYCLYSWISIKRARYKKSLQRMQYEEVGDGFDFLRKKRKLQSKGKLD